MANVAVQKKENGDTAAVARREWDPFRLMRDMLRWDPFREMAPALSVEIPSYSPAFEVKETKESFVFKADVPGTKEQDIEVNVAGNRLTISGKREAEKEDKGDTYYTYERSYGSFTRSFTLPEGVNANAIHADLRDGVLSIVLPKAPEAVAKKIPIPPASEQKMA